MTLRSLAPRPRPRGTGFTIIEILIAIVVLVLGITGIIALFPTAIDSGNQTIKDSYASAVTQSVVDAITVGIREARYEYRSTSGDAWTYFIFNHDGVVDPQPKRPESYDLTGVNQIEMSPLVNWDIPTGPAAPAALWDRDYCILLPRGVQIDPNTGIGTGLLTAPNIPNRVEVNEPWFLYPVPLDPSAEQTQRSPTAINSGSVIDNLHVRRWRPDVSDTAQPWYPRVFRLGTYRDPFPGSLGGIRVGQIREEFRGDDVLAEKTIAVDPYPNYSYAFAFQRSRVDADSAGPNGLIDANDPYSDSLYLVRVMIFKNFNHDLAVQLYPGNLANVAIPRTNLPIREFVTLIAL